MASSSSLSSSTKTLISVGSTEYVGARTQDGHLFIASRSTFAHMLTLRDVLTAGETYNETEKRTSLLPTIVDCLQVTKRGMENALHWSKFKDLYYDNDGEKTPWFTPLYDENQNDIDHGLVASHFLEC
jgi:hypothetical protein